MLRSFCKGCEAFVKGVNEIFEVEHLGRSNNNNINRLLQIGETRGFLGMLGSTTN